MFFAKLTIVKALLVKLANFAIARLDNEHVKKFVIDILLKEINNPKNKISPRVVALINAYFDGVNPKEELLELEKEVLTEE